MYKKGKYWKIQHKNKNISLYILLPKPISGYRQRPSAGVDLTIPRGAKIEKKRKPLEFGALGSWPTAVENIFFFEIPSSPPASSYLDLDPPLTPQGHYKNMNTNYYVSTRVNIKSSDRISLRLIVTNVVASFKCLPNGTYRTDETADKPYIICRCTRVIVFTL